MRADSAQNSTDFAESAQAVFWNAIIVPEAGRRRVAMDRETAARPLQRDNVISMKHWAKQHPIKICPTRYDEVGHIAQELMRYGAVEVRLERLDTKGANRILHFLSGVVFALGGYGAALRPLADSRNSRYRCRPGRAGGPGSTRPMRKRERVQFTVRAPAIFANL